MATNLIILHIFLLAIALGVSSAQNSREELRSNEVNQDKVIRLGRQMQHKSIDPSQVIQLSWQPRVFLYRDFLSEEECDYLISWANGKKPMQGDDSPKVEIKDTPANFGISMDADDGIARRIEERISAWTFLPKENSKSMWVLKFGSEDSTKLNFNYFHDKSTAQVDQPLLATVILYLSNATQGGQILFPRSGNKMWSDCTKNMDISRPRRGNAMVFFNLHLNATPDPSSFHARCPIIQGDMWCATKYFFLNTGMEKDPYLSDGSDCTDEDDNCPQWAAIGECKRNSVFMIGSPDYYGTCRKSCGAC